MSHVSSQSTKTDLQQTYDNVAYMRREKNFLEVRQVAIRRELKKIEHQIADSFEEEELLNLQDVADSLFSIGSDLEAHLDHLESQLEKVVKGVQEMEKLQRNTAAKKAFASYVLKDTQLTIKNLKQAHSYYDQVIQTVRNLS